MATSIGKKVRHWSSGPIGPDERLEKIKPEYSCDVSNECVRRMESDDTGLALSHPPAGHTHSVRR